MIPGEARRPPSLSNRPPTSVIAFSPVTFSVTATGTALRYQWRRDGVNISGGTNASLTFSPAPLTDANYSVAVFNAGGSVLSSNAFLTVFIPAAILAQPQSKAVFPNTANVSFSVTAASSTPIRYQWRFNGNIIPNATNTSYTLPIAQPGGDGDYTVVITDDVGPLHQRPGAPHRLAAPGHHQASPPIGRSSSAERPSKQHSPSLRSVTRPCATAGSSTESTLPRRPTSPA